MRLSIAAFIMMAELLVLRDEGRGATRAEENVLQASKSLKSKQEDPRIVQGDIKRSMRSRKTWWSLINVWYVVA